MPKQDRGRSFAGGDVSSKEIVVALERQDGRRERATFPNTAAGHKLLVSWLLPGDDRSALATVQQMAGCTVIVTPGGTPQRAH